MTSSSQLLLMMINVPREDGKPATLEEIKQAQIDGLC